MLQVTAATRLWPTLADAEKHYKEEGSSESCMCLVRQLHTLISCKMKKKRKSGRDLTLALHMLSKEPGQVPPKIHRGKASVVRLLLLLQGSSPAEELLMSTLDFWATALQHLGYRDSGLGLQAVQTRS